MRHVLFAVLVLVLSAPILAARAATLPGGPVSTPARGLTQEALAGKFVGEAASATRLTVIVRLQGAHLEQIPALEMAQADPHSPLYRHWLTPAQYGNYFGATAAQVQRTVAYLRGHGFAVSVVAPNNRYIVAQAPVRTVEAAFGTPIDMRLARDGRLYYANRFEPAVPAELPWVRSIGGLESYHLVHSHMVRAEQAALTAARSSMRPVPSATVIPGQFGFGPQDLWKAYSFNTSYTGSGQTIAIQVVTNFLPSDEFGYDSQFSLPNPSYDRIFLSGTCSSPCPFPTNPPGDLGETALDTEVSHAAAPGAALDIVSNTDALDSSQELSFEYIANSLASSVSIVSSSYGACESSIIPYAREGIAAVVDQGTLEGQTWVAAAGDDGADDCKTGLQDVDFPSSIPSMVAAGGTTLNTTVFLGNTQSYNSEYSWNDTGCFSNGLQIGGATGGGASRYFAKPAWQTGLTADDKVRDVPDVAAEADGYQQTQFPATCPALGGYYVLTDGKWGHVGGTSGAAPFWAGIFADIAQEKGARLGLVQPQLYALRGTASYHQITTGNNSWLGVAGYSAGLNYNQTTGLGSPVEATLLASYAATPPPTPSPRASFLPLEPHPTTTPTGAPTARAFVPIALPPSPFPSSVPYHGDIAVFDATVGAGQGTLLQLISATSESPVGVVPGSTPGVEYLVDLAGNVSKILTSSSPYTFEGNVFSTARTIRATAAALKGGALYIADALYGDVDVVPLSASSPRTISVGPGPAAIAANPTKNVLYVALEGQNSVAVIDSATNKLGTKVSLGSNPTQITVNGAGTTAYVVSSGSGKVTPLALGTTGTKPVVGKAVYVGGEPTSIALSPSGKLAFVTNLFCPLAASVCNPDGNESFGVVEVLTLNTTPVGVECCIVVQQEPMSAALEPTGRYLWVVNAGSNSASVIDTFTNTVVTTATTTGTATSYWQPAVRFIARTPQ